MAYSEIKGFKAFNGKRQNQFGVEFHEGEVYSTQNALRPGMYDLGRMNGFHMSTELANVFRFFKIPIEGIEVALVTGFGECEEFSDEYNGYYDMYVCENIRIDRFLKREEYINIILQEPEREIIKFISTFPMNDEEKKMFMEKFKDCNMNIVHALLYYQYGMKDIYTRVYKEGPVLKYGQNSNQRGQGK